MPFTAAEITSIGNATLEYFLNKGEAFDQSIQDKPLLAKMEGSMKTFSGGNENISVGIKGTYGAGGTNDGVVGYTHDDTVNFYTPSNIDRARYPWREHHHGIELTHTELKIDGLSVVDTNGAETKSHSRREMYVLVGLFENKLEDMAEMYARTMNALLWDNGVADSKALAGIRSIILDIPTLGTVGGIDASLAAKSWWRNRSRTAAFAADPSFDAAHGGGAVTSTPASGGSLAQTLQSEMRQLRRFGGRIDCFFAGSDFIGALEVEMRANGYYSQSGFRGSQDASMGNLMFDGIKIVYDPTLDDIGRSRYAYLWDSRRIYLMGMQDEWKKTHTPARPSNQFIMNRSMTCTGQMVAQQRNAALVIEIA